MLGFDFSITGRVVVLSGGSSWLNASTWTITDTTAVNTPAFSAELLTNGDFANWTGDDPDGWTVSGEDVNNFVTEVSGAARMVAPIIGQTSLHMTQVIGVSAGDWVRYSVDVTDVTSGRASLRVNAGAQIKTTLTAGVMMIVRRVETAIEDEVDLWRTAAVDNDFTLDDASAKSLSTSGAITVQETGANDIIATADIDAITADTQAGLCLCVDSESNPQNVVIVYSANANIVVDKRVGGTWSNVSTTASAFVASAPLRVEKSGNTFDTYYNGVLVKSDTIADAGIVSNTKHGLFSTDSSNQFSDFSFTPN